MKRNCLDEGPGPCNIHCEEFHLTEILNYEHEKQREWIHFIQCQSMCMLTLLRECMRLYGCFSATDRGQRLMFCSWIASDGELLSNSFAAKVMWWYPQSYVHDWWISHLLSTVQSVYCKPWPNHQQNVGILVWPGKLDNVCLRWPGQI